MTQNHKVRKPRGHATSPIGRWTIESARRNGFRRVASGQHRRDPEAFVVVRGRARRPQRFVRGFTPIACEVANGSDVERPKAPEQRSDRCAIGPVPWLADGCLPATAEALARPSSEGFAEKIVQEGAQHELRGICPYGVADGRMRGRMGRQSTIDLCLNRQQSGLTFIGKEPLDRRPESDRRGVRNGEPVELVVGQAFHTLQEARDEVFRPGRGTAHNRAPGWAMAGLGGETVSHGATEAALVIVAGPELGDAQPVVGNVDAFGLIEAVRPGHIGVMSTQEGAPCDLNRLGRGIGRQLEPGVEVVVRQRGAR